MSEMISKEQYSLFLKQERKIAGELQRYFIDFAGIGADTTELRQVMASLDDPFLVVVVGEFNAGKSTCINILLKENLLAFGELPTTAQITLIRYGEKREPFEDDNGTLYIHSPAQFLQNISIVDTPGVNAVLREHQHLTEDFVPRSDLILFITAADRPFAQTEREFLERIRSWGKKVVLILNKIDHLADSANPSKTEDFVRENCKELLGFEPKIFPTSALKAQQADKAAGREAGELWVKGGFSAVEDYLSRTLDNAERLYLKLSTPLNGMQYLLKHLAPIIDQHSHLLDEYDQSVNNINKRLAFYREAMERDLSQCISEVETIILDMRVRGDQFFDKKMRIGNVFQLFKSKSMSDAFEREVIGDIISRIDDLEQRLKTRFTENDEHLQQDVKTILNQLQTAQKLFDRLTEHEHKFQQSILTELKRLSTVSTQQDNDIVGTVDKQLEADRNEIIERVRRTTHDMVEAKNYIDIAAKHLKKLQNTATSSTLAGAGIGGLGIAAAPLLGVVAIEVGALFSIGLLSFGIYSIGDKRTRAKEDFDTKIEEWRTKRRNPLKEKYREELENAIGHIQHIVEQYATYVHFEQERTAEMKRQTARLDSEIAKLKKEIDSMKVN